MTSLRCPVCGEPLFLQQKSYRCKKGHSFDLSREGYCNLILSGRRHGKTPGDNQDMARARNQFFAGDHYRILLDALSAQVLKYLPQDGTLVDAGCGEGYYTAGIFSALQQAGLRPSARSEELTLEDFCRLTSQIFEDHFDKKV